MATANTTSPRAAKAGAKAAKPAAARKASSGASARARNTTQAKATRAKSARTRAAHQAGATVRQAETATRDTAGVFGDYAERAILIPVGAALLARERVISTVSDTLTTYSSTAKAQAQLRRFERRGTTARNRLEREVRKARVRFERELRQRRRELEQRTKSLSTQVEQTQSQIESAVKDGADLANRVQERILSLV
jgi:hypothetical protein